MINFLFLFIKTIQFFFYNIIIQLVKKRDYYINFFTLFLIISFLNFFLFVPYFFLIKNILFLIIFFIILILDFLFFIFLFLFNYKNKEYNNNRFIFLSTYKEDFFYLIKNNLFFCFQLTIIFTFLVFIYQFIFSSLFLLIFNIKVLSYLKILLFYFIFIFFISFIFLFIIYTKYRQNKKLIFKINNYNTQFKNSSNIFLIPVFIIIFLFNLYILSNLLKIQIQLVFIINIIISLCLTFIFKLKIKTLSVNSILKNLLKIFFTFINSIKTFRLENLRSLNSIYNSIKYILPVIVLVVSLLIFMMFKVFVSYKLIIINSFLIFLFFCYPYFIKLSNIQLNKKSFFLLIIIYSIFILLSFLPKIELNLTIDDNSILFLFKDFIYPVIDVINLFFSSLKIFFNNINFIYVILIPISFIILFFLFNKIFIFSNILINYFDNRIKKELNRNNSLLLFGDSISLYPFIFTLIINLFIILIIKIEEQPFINFIYNIIKTFQVESVFKFKFLSYDNISKTISFIFNIFTIYIVIKSVHYFFYSLFSHFMLFSDEIVFIENKIYSKTILRIPLSKINYIIIKQNILEFLFDIGTVYIETQDKNGLIKIKGISSIKEKNKIIMEKIKIDLQKIK